MIQLHIRNLHQYTSVSTKIETNIFFIRSEVFANSKNIKKTQVFLYEDKLRS